MAKLPYDEIEILVAAYQEGSPDAIETLIENYEGYFERLLSVVKVKIDGKFARFDIDDSVQRGFAALFMKTPGERKIVNIYRKMVAAQIRILRTVSRIRFLFQDLDANDIRQNMRMIFMEMAKEHRGTKFYNYISTTFPKKVMKMMYKMLSKFEEEPFDEELSWEYGYVWNDTYSFEKRVVKYPIISREPSMYDINWVNGDCEVMFDHLTPYERRILKLYYEEKTFFPQDFKDKSMYAERKQHYRCSDTDIADDLGVSRKTVNKKRNEIVATIEEIALEQRMVRGAVYAGT